MHGYRTIPALPRRQSTSRYEDLPRSTVCQRTRQALFTVRIAAHRIHVGQQLEVEVALSCLAPPAN